ncbi:MAG: polymer-forming cytoskeletal protein [bacterium]
MGIFGGSDKKEIIEGAFDTVIGKKAKFKGELNSAGGVSISGEFEGKLNAEGDLIIAQGSKVAGEIKGGCVVVSGRVDGNIVAVHNLEITRTGRVNGDLTGGRIVIEEGSSYRGKVQVAVEDEAKPEETKVEIVEDRIKDLPAQENVPQPQMF